MHYILGWQIHILGEGIVWHLTSRYTTQTDGFSPSSSFFLLVLLPLLFFFFFFFFFFFSFFSSSSSTSTSLLRCQQISNFFYFLCVCVCVCVCMYVCLCICPRMVVTREYICQTQWERKRIKRIMGVEEH